MSMKAHRVPLIFGLAMSTEMGVPQETVPSAQCEVRDLPRQGHKVWPAVYLRGELKPATSVHISGLKNLSNGHLPSAASATASSGRWHRVLGLDRQLLYADVPWERSAGHDAATGARHDAADTAALRALQPDRLLYPGARHMHRLQREGGSL